MKEIQIADGQVQADGDVNLGVKMKRVPITEDQIIKAGMSLEADGMPINGWSLRKRIGDRGNPRRLHETWVSFRTKERMAPTEVPATALQEVSCSIDVR